MKLQLYNHQKELLQKNPSKCGIFWECGTGKTLTAIKLVEKNSRSCLVICPKSLKTQWYQEIEKFKEYDDFKWMVLTKEEFRKYADGYMAYQSVIVDEAHLGFFNFKSQLHKALDGYIKRVNPDHLYLLTATPYTSSVWSIYSAGKLLGQNWNWYKWKKHFFYDISMGRRTIPIQRTGIEPEIAEITSKIGFTKRLDECVDVPPQIYQTEYFSLNKDQKRYINDLVDILPIVRFTKIHQLESGCLKSDGYSKDLLIDCDKTKRIIELCTEHKKIAIVCRYNLQLKMYYDVIQCKNKFIINGKTKDKSDIIKKVNELDECVVLINSACGEGYNLPTVPIMVFASMDFSFVKYTQVCGRIQRLNNIKKNVYLHLLTEGKSVDKEVFDCVQRKEDFNAEIFHYEEG